MHRSLLVAMAGALSSVAVAPEAAAGNINDGRGGHQVDEGKGRQEEERPAVAAGASGGESELQVRSDELRSTWVWV